MKVIVKKQKPTSPGRRGMVKVSVAGLHKGKPYEKLLEPQKTSSGRNNLGRITAWQRGGGVKQKYRIIDFKRNDKDNIPAKVERFEYDPNRTAVIALILFADGERRYILAPNKLNVGDTILSGSDSPISAGNCLPMSSIPLGTMIHAIELKPGKGAQLCRSAGTSAQLLAKEGKYVTIRLRSGEMRKVLATCRATVGEVFLTEHRLRKDGKAGVPRKRNRRPNVRGVVMNPVDHPLGGGEGRSSGGRPPCSPWGVPTGKKTRKRKKASSRLIVKRRKNKSEK